MKTEIGRFRFYYLLKTKNINIIELFNNYLLSFIYDDIICTAFKK